MGGILDSSLSLTSPSGHLVSSSFKIHSESDGDQIFFFLVGGQGLTLSPRLEYSGSVMTHCSLDLLDSGDPPDSVSLSSS